MSKLQDQVFELNNSTETEQFFQYKFPAFKDPEGTKVILSIDHGLEDFMKYDQANQRITMKPAKPGQHSLLVKL